MRAQMARTGRKGGKVKRIILNVLPGYFIQCYVSTFMRFLWNFGGRRAKYIDFLLNSPRNDLKYQN